jgi:hypothetical protein
MIEEVFKIPSVSITHFWSCDQVTGLAVIGSFEVKLSIQNRSGYYNEISSSLFTLPPALLKGDG